MRLGVVSLAAAVCTGLALASAGCGGTSGGGGSQGGASVLPASSLAYVASDTDLGSDQWKKVDVLLSKFPARENLLTSIRKGLADQNLNYERDIKPALGDEVDVAVIGATKDAAQVVGLTKAKDQKKLDALIAKLDKSSGGSPSVHKIVDGWTVISDKQTTLDKVQSSPSGGSLADDQTFKDAMAALPTDTLTSAYVNGSNLTGLLKRYAPANLGSCGSLGAFQQGKLVYVAASVDAKSDGIRLQVKSKGSGGVGGTGTYKSQLLGEAPAGALVYFSFHGPQGKASSQVSDIFGQLQTCSPQFKTGLQQVEKQLGVSLAKIGSLFKGENAVYVRTGTPIPEVTLLTQVSDEQGAKATLDTLAARLGKASHSTPSPTQIAGVNATQLKFGQFSIYYAVFDGKMVVTSSTAGIAGIKAGGQKLEDDAVFKEAKKAAGMGDSTGGFLFVNFKDGIPLVESLGQFAGASIPSSVIENLRPLRTFLVYGDSTSGNGSLTAFLEIK